MLCLGAKQYANRLLHEFRPCSGFGRSWSARSSADYARHYICRILVGLVSGAQFTTSASPAAPARIPSHSDRHDSSRSR